MAFVPIWSQVGYKRKPANIKAWFWCTGVGHNGRQSPNDPHYWWLLSISISSQYCEGEGEGPVNFCRSLLQKQLVNRSYSKKTMNTVDIWRIFLFPCKQITWFSISSPTIKMSAACIHQNSYESRKNSFLASDELQSLGASTTDKCRLLLTREGPANRITHKLLLARMHSNNAKVGFHAPGYFQARMTITIRNQITRHEKSEAKTCDCIWTRENNYEASYVHFGEAASIDIKTFKVYDTLCQSWRQQSKSCLCSFIRSVW